MRGGRCSALIVSHFCLLAALPFYLIEIKNGGRSHNSALWCHHHPSVPGVDSHCGLAPFRSGVLFPSLVFALVQSNKINFKHCSWPQMLFFPPNLFHRLREGGRSSPASTHSAVPSLQPINQGQAGAGICTNIKMSAANSSPRADSRGLQPPGRVWLRSWEQRSRRSLGHQLGTASPPAAPAEGSPGSGAPPAP